MAHLSERCTFRMRQSARDRSPSVAVVGLGYVGLPLAEAFARHVTVVGVDSDTAKVQALRSSILSPNLTITADPAAMSGAEFIIIAVPTPVTRFKEPDLDFVRGAAESVGRHLRRGTTVILESTVYPGVTEEIMVPILESASGLRCGTDFAVAYCPERINPGDLEHTIEKSTKVVSGSTAEVAVRVASLYGRIAGSVFVARDIRTAEAAKVIENVQRDLNIALVNELSLIFSKLGLDTAAVLEAAATKWNFHRYSPGMVGGHCIPVDPYYLVHRAKELGYHPQVILAGRSINDSMPKVVAEITVKALNDARKVIRDSRVLVMGLTYKEDVPDMRESPSLHLVEELGAYGCEVVAWDPLVADAELPSGARRAASLAEARDLDAIVTAVAHQSFRALSLDDLRARMRRDPVLVDVRRVHDRHDAEQHGFLYRTL
jgi:UDP-N-acetyl-D-glucosamine/UDP-N-acetyl-D-galactosamine dehydrogenase